MLESTTISSVSYTVRWSTIQRHQKLPTVEKAKTCVVHSSTFVSLIFAILLSRQVVMPIAKIITTVLTFFQTQNEEITISEME